MPCLLETLHRFTKRATKVNYSVIIRRRNLSLSRDPDISLGRSSTTLLGEMTVKKIVTGLALVAFAACGGGSNPKNYVASVDTTTWANLPSSCLPSDETNVFTNTETNNNITVNFSIWQSSDGKTTVLDMDPTSINDLFTEITSTGFWTSANVSGFAAGVGTTLTSADGKAFASTGDSKYAETGLSCESTGSLTITFTDTSYTKATITAAASVNCNGDGADADAENYNCAPPALSFIARAVDGNNTIIYSQP